MQDKSESKRTRRRQVLSKVLWTIIFFTILFVILNLLNKATLHNLEFVDSDMIYKQPDNSIDAIFVGTSIYARSISPDTIWLDSGISTYNRSSGRLSPQMTWLYLVDALKHQSPKVAFIYTPQLVQATPNPVYELRNIYPLHWSGEKVDIISSMLNESDKLNIVDFVFPLLEYHGTLTTESNKITPPPKNDFAHGQAPKWSIRSQNDPDYSLMGRINPNKKPDFQYDEKSLEYYRKSIEVCLDHGVTPVFLAPPTSNWNNELHYATQKLADEYDIDFLDMNTDEFLDELKIDTKADFYDHYGPEHMNGFGAIKVSNYISNYLKTNFNPSNENRDKVTNIWKRDTKKYLSTYAKYLNE